MKNVLLVLLVLFLASCSSNDTGTLETGVKFEDTSLEAAFAKAKQLGKAVMVDVYSDN